MRMHPNVYLDSPEDDFEYISGEHADSRVWLVPACTNDDGDLFGLLLQRKKENPGLFRRVGLTIVPRYVSRSRSRKESSVDGKGNFKSVKKEVVRIV